MAGIREGFEVRIAGVQADSGIYLRADEGPSLWLRLEGEDADGEVRVDRAKLEQATAFLLDGP